MLKRRVYSVGQSLALFACLAGCVDKASLQPRLPDRVKADDPSFAVHTEIVAAMRVDPDNTVVVTCGQPLRVRCAARRDGAFLDYVPMHVRVDPPAPVLRATTVETLLDTHAPGAYHVRCAAAADPVAVLDATGVKVRFEAPLAPPGGEDENDTDDNHTDTRDETVDGPGGDVTGDVTGDNPLFAERPTSPGAPGPAPQKPGMPYAWSAHWPEAPQGNCYWQNRKQFLLRRRVLDRQGRAIPGVKIRIRSEPAADIDEAEGSISFPHAGIYQVTAEVEGPTDEGATLTPLVHTFQVDSTPPHIEITSPQRGAMLQGGGFGRSTVQVQGFIEDESGLTEATINGQALALEPGQKRKEFSTTVEAPWGLTTLRATARDTCDMHATLAQSFLRSPEFATSSALPAPAVRARLGQAVMDDGQRGQLSNVASVIEETLKDDTLRKLFPEHLSAYPDHDADGRLDEVTHRCPSGPYTHKRNGHEVVRNGDFSFSSARVESLEANHGRWDVRVAFADLRLPVQINAYVDLGCLGTFRSFSMDADILAKQLTLAFEVDVSNDEPRLSVRKEAMHAEFSTNDPHIDFQSQPYLFSMGPTLLVQQVKDGVFLRLYRHLFAEALEERLRREVISALSYFLESLQLDDTIVLPAGPAKPLRFTTTIDHLEVGGAPPHGFGEVGLAASVTAQAQGPMGWGVVTLPQRGPIRGAPSTPDLALGVDQTVSMALYDDFINQGLYALWAQDAFTIADLGALMRTHNPQTPAGIHLYLFSSLPPVLMPGDGPQEVALGWGDLYVDANFDVAAITEGRESDAEMLHVTLYVSALLKARLEIDPQTQRLSLANVQAPEVHIQAVELGDPGHQALASTQLQIWLAYGLPHLQTLLQEAVPQLTKNALRNMPLPLFNFTDNAVAPATWRLDHPSLTRPPHENYSVLKGRLVRVLAQPQQ